MKAPRFQRAKVARTINTLGDSYEFFRYKLDEFKEPTDEADSIAVVKGVYRNTSAGYISVTGTEAASVHSKTVPMILVLWDDNVKQIQQRDFVVINGKELLVTGVDNINGWNLFAEISLEEVLHGIGS